MIEKYINKLSSNLQTGVAREHSYRPALKELIESLNSAVTAVNEPSRSAHGAPDFVFKKSVNKDITLGYVETKDVTVNLDDIEKTEQLKRYLGYPNLILTNYIEFRFFRNGEKNLTISVAELNNNALVPLREHFGQLEQELKAFLDNKPENITNAKRLSQIMGGKARRVRENVAQYLTNDHELNKELLRMFKIFQRLLVHDLTSEKFADMYAQTLVYGLFVARYYDTTPDTFSREEARDLIPASNPFLRKFFDHIAGADFDKRLQYIVDELCDVFTVSDIRLIILRHYNLFGEVSDKDPIIHFYEDFLKEYDPELKKQMGAYYTPVSVVHFILNAVDQILKTEFQLDDGLLSIVKIDHPVIRHGKKQIIKLHKVQILDPAVGTATFLNELIKLIHKNFITQEGLWRSYVESELLPRIYGFELMVAPYTIAHLKLAMTLKETGIDEFHKRLGVYLTNTLEEGIKLPDDLFSSVGIVDAISEESNAASLVKNEKPIMVIIGNPPYSGESFNKGEYAMKLVEKYKYEPGGNEKLRERNPKWINDDYVKFFAFAQEMIMKNGEGIVAMITNHGYIDNATFRGMRWNLIKTFSSIYILDLHGNAKKKEVVLDGSKDENVFDIQQGVAIIIGVKNKSKNKGLADVYKADIWGKRQAKFEFLLENSIDKVKWENINLREPSYTFLNKDEIMHEEYEKGVKINELFPLNGVGLTTAHDNLVINNDKDELIEKAKLFGSFEGTNADLCKALKIKEKIGWDISKARDTIRNEQDLERFLKPIAYRPFDIQFCFYHSSLVWRTVNKIMSHFILGPNIGLSWIRPMAASYNFDIFIQKNISDQCYAGNKSAGAGISYTGPLYLYPEQQQNLLVDVTKRKPNLDMGLVKQLLINIGEYELIDDHEDKKRDDKTMINPLDILDYSYGSMHSPYYRDKYKDFLKLDFPRVPVARDVESFWKLVSLGSQLRQLHLLEDPVVLSFSTSYSVTGSNLIEKVGCVGDKVFINDTQYFGNVPKLAWEFYIGGYQPAQKWLKDRKGKILSYDDIIHYQKIIKVLVETDKIMKEIDL